MNLPFDVASPPRRLFALRRYAELGLIDRGFDSEVRVADPAQRGFSGQWRPRLRQTRKAEPPRPWLSRSWMHSTALREHFDISLAGPGFINFRLKPIALLGLVAGLRFRGTPPKPARPSAHARPDLGRGLLVAQHRQADARRPPALRRHWRGHLPPARLHRREGHPRQPPRRLGHTVRQTHLWPTSAGLDDEALAQRAASRNSNASTSSATTPPTPDGSPELDRSQTANSCSSRQGDAQERRALAKNSPTSVPRRLPAVIYDQPRHQVFDHNARRVLL